MGKVAFSVCFALSMLAAAVTAQPSTWLRDYLEPPKAKAMSGHYYRLDTKSVCFRQYSYCQLKCPGTSPCNLESINDYDNLACTECPEEHPYGYGEYHSYSYERHHDLKSEGVELVADSPNLSKCYLHKVKNEPVPVSGKTGVYLVGTFTGTCIINEKAECAPEGCEGVEVSITGLAYKLDNAVMVGPQYGGAGGKLDNVCKNGPSPIREEPNSDLPSDKKLTDGTVGTAGVDANIAGTPNGGGSTKPQVFKGKVTVYTGPFTVHSTGPRKYERGYFQFSTFDEEGLVDADTVTTLPRFGDETYKFEFINEHPEHPHMHRD